MERLRLLEAVLRAFEDRATDDAVDVPGDYNRHEVTGDEGRCFTRMRRESCSLKLETPREEVLQMRLDITDKKK